MDNGRYPSQITIFWPSQRLCIFSVRFSRITMKLQPSKSSRSQSIGSPWHWKSCPSRTCPVEHLRYQHSAYFQAPLIQVNSKTSAFPLQICPMDPCPGRLKKPKLKPLGFEIQPYSLQSSTDHIKRLKCTKTAKFQSLRQVWGDLQPKPQPLITQLRVEAWNKLPFICHL